MLQGVKEGDIRQFLDEFAEQAKLTIRLAEGLTGIPESYAGTTSGSGSIILSHQRVPNPAGGPSLTGEAAITVLEAFQKALRPKDKRPAPARRRIRRAGPLTA
jgi:hypothetical protein